MLVGDVMTGKTTTLQIMINCLNLINRRHISTARKEKNQSTWLHIINPKSMSLNHLYGKLDMVTKEWTEGVLGEVYRKCCNSTGTDQQIILLDGPVDTEWVDNLNTVLDDNKKLCLLNGDVLFMTPQMSILFEVSNLSGATLATVSRCGMSNLLIN